MTTLKPVQKVALIAHWSMWFFDKYDLTKERTLGRDLAYLFAAIARGATMQASPRSGLVKALKDHMIEEDSMIWWYIEVV